MSGQATGWVLRHGPRDRALRLVLIAIADAANRDGEHARPGIQAICEGALYSERTVYRAIAQLVEDRWLEQTNESGPGQVTEYRLPRMAENTCQNGRCLEGKHLPNTCHSYGTRSEQEAFSFSNTDTGTRAGARAGARGTSPRRSKETPAPESLELDETRMGWAITREAVAAGIDIARERDQFLDRSQAKGLRYTDWDAAFRTWLRNAIKFSKAAQPVEVEVNPNSFGRIY